MNKLFGILFSVLLFSSLIPNSFALTDPHGNEVICYNEDLNVVPCNHSSAIATNSNSTEVSNGKVTSDDKTTRVTEKQLKQEEEKAKETLEKKPATTNVVRNANLEDLQLANPQTITNENQSVCGQTHLNDVTLPFTMTVKYPQTLDVDLLVSANSPEKSEMKAIRDVDFFTVDTKNSTDVFTISAFWEFESKPNDNRFITYEVFSDNKRIEQQAIPFNDFTYCHYFTVETEQKVHVPTLEEFLEENDIRINNAFEVVAQLFLDNNDLTLILIVTIIGAVVVIIMLIAVLIWFVRDVSKKSEEAEGRFNDAVNHVNEIIANLKILSRHDYSQNDIMRSSYMQAISFGSTTIGNLIIDLRNVLQKILEHEPNIDVELKTPALKPKEEIKEILDEKPKEKSGLAKIFDFKKNSDKKDKKKDATTFEFYFERYSDAKKYPSEKLAIKDEKLREQYQKSPTEKLLNEINAVTEVIKKRMGIKK
ncbi:MAG: hypothetical protein K5790_10555 [Nitrosopumilus sp.]|uniref:hypothetical protein n=1 Tax=Nitrosopumilus sp. TaxID=2024843 RepID=UPI00247BC263|nr:hypothetical protein [Nitrosopumilus sp.]MCV0393711.1 hypothetical protein [Nitrosopumilus sp.]